MPILDRQCPYSHSQESADSADSWSKSIIFQWLAYFRSVGRLADIADTWGEGMIYANEIKVLSKRRVSAHAKV
jgi:hypothetical protein